jgi:hypothetical protein
LISHNTYKTNWQTLKTNVFCFNYRKEIRSFSESHLSGLNHFDGVLEGLLLRHLGPVDRDPLKLEASRTSVDWAVASVVTSVVFAVACGGNGGYKMRNKTITLFLSRNY